MKKLSADAEKDFEVTHLGVEMFPKMEGGHRSFETYHNMPKLFDLSNGTITIDTRHSNYIQCVYKR